MRPRVERLDRAGLTSGIRCLRNSPLLAKDMAELVMEDHVARGQPDGPPVGLLGARKVVLSGKQMAKPPLRRGVSWIQIRRFPRDRDCVIQLTTLRKNLA